MAAAVRTLESLASNHVSLEATHWVPLHFFQLVLFSENV